MPPAFAGSHPAFILTHSLRCGLEECRQLCWLRYCSRIQRYYALLLVSPVENLFSVEFLGVFHIPTVLGAVVPAYNLPSVKAELKFTPEVLAGIFLGKINKWNDSTLAQANPGVKLPDTDIIVVHRSEGSGTTYIWTDYLSKISDEWKTKVGKNASVNWPVGLGAKGNDGVTGQIKQTEGSIGYVELIYALQNKIPFGTVKNAAGQFVKASLQSVTEAAASIKEMPDDFRVSITKAPVKGAYPIISFTWLLVSVEWSYAVNETVFVYFLNWMMTHVQ